MLGPSGEANTLMHKLPSSEFGQSLSDKVQKRQVWRPVIELDSKLKISYQMT